MNNFDEQLLRLKQAVKLTEDQDVAALLGMTKAAFSVRKKRGVFPEDKLFALATRRPDLHLDVLNILAGDKKDAAVKLTIAELEAALAYAADDGGTVAEQLKRAAALVEEMHAPLPPDEQMWMDCYRDWSPALKKRELARALSLVDYPNEVIRSPEHDIDVHSGRDQRKPAPKSTISIGTLHGQSVEGGLTNHGPMTFGVSPPIKAKKSK